MGGAIQEYIFASDQHLGAPDQKSSQVREQLFVKWLTRSKMLTSFSYWVTYLILVRIRQSCT